MPKQQLSFAESISLLEHQRVGHLATCSTSGTPYITPLNFVYYDGSIFFHCAATGQKLDNISINDQVCFAVHQVDKQVFQPEACRCSTYYRSVLAYGSAKIVIDAARKVEVLNALTAKFADGRDFRPVGVEAASRCTVVEIAVTTIDGKRNGATSD